MTHQPITDYYERHLQIRALSKADNSEQLSLPSDEAIQSAYKIARKGAGGVNRTTQSSTTSQSGPNSEWQRGELEWEAWMRALDRLGFCTGHVYRT